LINRPDSKIKGRVHLTAALRQSPVTGERSLHVLLESQAEAITTQVTNEDTTVECDITPSLVVPNFTLQPTDNQRLIALTPSESSTLTWRVTPTGVGPLTLAFTARNAAAQIGVSVVSGNGFIPAQPQTFNYVAILFGFLVALLSLVVWQRWSSRRSTLQSPQTESNSSS
jgi:hypothetical protein